MTYNYDIEVVINCVTFVFLDVNTDKKYIDDYVKADINKDEIALKSALTNLNFKEFIIYNEVNQLSALVSFLRSKNTNVLVSYNGHKYDDLILDYILNNYSVLSTYSVDRLITTLYNISQDIIAYQSVGNVRRELDIKYSKQYISIDLMRLHRLDKLKVSLKQVSIALKWYRVEDYTPPEPTDAEIAKYGYNRHTEWYNHYVQPHHLAGLLFYNRNDVLITYTLYYHGLDELKNRVAIQTKYKVNVLSLSRSSSADMLMSKFYSDSTGLEYWDFKDKRTHRRVIKFKDLIADDIKFETKQLQEFLNHLKEIVINVAHDSFSETLIYEGTGYTFAQGGLHSKDKAEKLISTDKYKYRDADVASFYPNIIIKYGFTPKHLSKEAFISILSHITRERLAAKHSGDKTTADILKIVINSVFGKLGFEYGFLYDLLCLYQVTINGQLNLLMLIELLETNGIHVVSANTDGIVAKVFNNQNELYYKLCKQWEELTGFDLEYTDYKKYIRLNVNSYISITDYGVKTKNDFTTSIQIDKGYFAPCIAKTLYEYYVNDNHDIDKVIKTFDIYDYCISVKVGSQFVSEYHTLKDNKVHVEKLQKNNRYYVSNTGGVFLKHKDDGTYTNVLKGKYVRIFNTYYESDDYDINYNWYAYKVKEMVNKINGNNTKDMKKYTGSLFDEIE